MTTHEEKRTPPRVAPREAGPAPEEARTTRSRPLPGEVSPTRSGTGAETAPGAGGTGAPVLPPEVPVAAPGRPAVWCGTGGHAPGACHGLPPETRTTPATGTQTQEDPPAAGNTGAGGPGAAPGRPADPVRELMHRHRALCAHAVDPLEIAAGLEAHGVTDRTAARFRHRDVFSLADELYARVPRAEEGVSRTAAPPGPRTRAAGPGEAAVALLPGVLGTVTLAAPVLGAASPAPVRTAVTAVGATAAGVAVRAVLRRLSHAAPAALFTLSACWLTAYALFGDWLLNCLLGRAPAVDGGPGLSGPWAPADVAVPLTLAFAVAPAAWAVRRFGVRAERRLAGSHSLDVFTRGMRPLLARTVAGFAVALAVLHAVVRLVVDGTGGMTGGAGAPGPSAGLTALGLLLFTALLLTVHGFPSAASVGLGAASLAEVAVLACALVARNPWSGGTGGGFAEAVAEHGAGLAPAVVCGALAAVLLVYAFRTLTGASAHHREPAC